MKKGVVATYDVNQNKKVSRASQYEGNAHFWISYSDKRIETDQKCRVVKNKPVTQVNPTIFSNIKMTQGEHSTRRHYNGSSFHSVHVLLRCYSEQITTSFRTSIEQKVAEDKRLNEAKLESRNSRAESVESRTRSNLELLTVVPLKDAVIRRRSTTNRLKSNGVETKSGDLPLLCE